MNEEQQKKKKAYEWEAGKGTFNTTYVWNFTDISEVGACFYAQPSGVLENNTNLPNARILTRPHHVGQRVS